MRIEIEKEVIEYLKEKGIYNIKLSKRESKGSKWCPVIFQVQVELIKNLKDEHKKMEKVNVEGIEVFVERTVPKENDYKIFKTLKIPFLPMIIEAEKI